MISCLLYQFMKLVENNKIEIYNEFSLQHELGIFLRNNLTEYKVQFERNTKFFGISGTIKHEMDIVIYNDVEKYAIELKYPVNGQYPEQMFSFIKDICFMEELKYLGFTKTFCLVMVNDKNFYSGKKTDGIYAYFREGNTMSGKIVKPTGKRDEAIALKETYKIDWKGNGRIKFYMIEIG